MNSSKHSNRDKKHQIILELKQFEACQILYHKQKQRDDKFDFIFSGFVFVLCYVTNSVRSKNFLLFWHVFITKEVLSLVPSAKKKNKQKKGKTNCRKNLQPTYNSNYFGPFERIFFLPFWQRTKEILMIIIIDSMIVWPVNGIRASLHDSHAHFFLLFFSQTAKYWKIIKLWTD